MPIWVYRVNSCPDPGDLSQWVEASKKLNCYHNLTSSDPSKQAMVYHCLPSSFLNETVEFCGTSVPIPPGISLSFSHSLYLSLSLKHNFALSTKIFLINSQYRSLHMLSNSKMKLDARLVFCFCLLINRLLSSL